MVFSNDLSRINEAQATSFRRVLLIVIPSFIWGIFTLAIVLKDYDNYAIIILTTFFGGLISAVFGLYLGQRSSRKEYQKYKIIAEENSIEICSTINKVIKINIEEIKEITINKAGVITIAFKHSKINVSKYIYSYDELKKIFSTIKPIIEVNNKIDYLRYSSILFFVGLFLIRFVPDYRLYLIIAIGFIITTMISTIKMLLSPIKKLKILIPFGINAFLIVIISKNVINLVNRILNR